MDKIKKTIFKILLFILRVFPPETSSYVSLFFLNFMNRANKKIFKFKNIKTLEKITFKNLEFNHCLGLAAGIDKEGKYYNALGNLGFSFVEIGTFTPIAQRGNSYPRIKRIKNKHSLINRLGFNNPGIIQGVKNIRQTRDSYNGIIGVSIGKNRLTPIQDAHKDYTFCLRECYEVADYVAINISSPNTEDLRKLSSFDYIEDLMKHIHLEMKMLQKEHKKETPIFLKLSPDEKEENIENIISTSLNHNISGFIISNTTFGNYKGISGGISGELLKEKSLKMLCKVNELLNGRSILISSGGISNKVDLEQRLDNGAKLVQIYTSFVYQGPYVINELLN